MTLTGGYGRVDPAHAKSVLGYAALQGVSLVDTADSYVGGEEIVASVRQANPDHPFQTVTKVGLTGPPGQRGVCGRPECLERACDASLRRLRVERLDILLLHRIDPEVPVEVSMSALAGLVRAGKVAEIGVCTSDSETLRRAASSAPVSYVQARLSVLAPVAAAGLLPTVRELNATLLAFSPLGRGLVAVDRDPSGFSADDARAYVPEMDIFHRSRAAGFRLLADQIGVSAAVLALSWLASLGPDVIPIPGARSTWQVEQNLDAQRRELSASELHAVGAFVSAGSDFRVG